MVMRRMLDWPDAVFGLTMTRKRRQVLLTPAERSYVVLAGHEPPPIVAASYCTLCGVIGFAIDSFYDGCPRPSTCEGARCALQEDDVNIGTLVSIGLRALSKKDSPHA